MSEKKDPKDTCVLVTGGAGFIGSHTVVELLQDGYEVVIVDDLSNASEKVLDRIDTLVLSEAESRLVSGIAVHDEQTAHVCMEALAKAGVGHTLMFVQGVGLIYRGDDGGTVTVPLPEDTSHAMRYENGAASGAMSALLWARMEGRDDSQSARLAAAAAALSMRQVTSVFPEINARVLLDHAGLGA